MYFILLNNGVKWCKRFFEAGRYSTWRTEYYIWRCRDNWSTLVVDIKLCRSLRHRIIEMDNSVLCNTKKMYLGFHSLYFQCKDVHPSNFCMKLWPRHQNMSPKVPIRAFTGVWTSSCGCQVAAQIWTFWRTIAALVDTVFSSRIIDKCSFIHIHVISWYLMTIEVLNS